MEPLRLLSPATFTQHFENFRRLIESHPDSDGPFVDFRSGLAARLEGYKDTVHEEACRRLAIETWSDQDVGSGRILERVIHAIEIPGDEDHRNNLVHWEARFGEDGRAHRRLREARTDLGQRRRVEQLLLDLYTRTGPPSKPFDALAKEVGKKYDLLAYLFFLLDKDRFLPISVGAFERAFDLLGMPLALSHQASWQNYRAYLARIRQVHERLEIVVPGTRLLDAHSFCWILSTYLETPATSREVAKAITRLDFSADARRRPDARARWRFHAAWRSTDFETSGDAQSSPLTWEHLGHRLGDQRRDAPAEFIRQVFDVAVREHREQQFHETMEALYTRIGRETDQEPPHRFLQAVRNRGGLAYAKHLLRPGTSVTTRFGSLLAEDRADLTVEALVLGPSFSELFEPEELAEARRRLHDVPTTAFPATVEAADLFPERVPDDGDHYEGHTRTVVVNRYERDSAARRKCIDHHGCRCHVCRLDFRERYGKIGEGFIHVHHKMPLALRRERYKVDPKKDLVPVCPNCHAMLHKENPPMSIEDLRAQLRD